MSEQHPKTPQKKATQKLELDAEELEKLSDSLRVLSQSIDTLLRALKAQPHHAEPIPHGGSSQDRVADDNALDADEIAQLTPRPTIH